jgi:hypothetical protein
VGRVSKEAAAMKAYHDIRNLHFSGEYMVLTVDGTEKRLRIKEVSPALEHASEEQRNTFDISPSVYGIHWPLLDEDIAVDGLLGITHIRETRRRTA